MDICYPTLVADAVAVRQSRNRERRFRLGRTRGQVVWSRADPAGTWPAQLVGMGPAVPADVAPAGVRVLMIEPHPARGWGSPGLLPRQVKSTY